MKSNKKIITKELIVETTLTLIQETGGIRNVNLRGIAKRIGCNHTNLYNYFSSLDDIFWEAVAQAVLKMVEYSNSNLNNEDNPEEKLYLLLSNMIDFSFKHPSWYRLIWLEQIKMDHSKEVFKKISIGNEKFQAEVIKSSGNRISKDVAANISDILFGYFNGEVCKWISRHENEDNIEEIKLKILSNLKYLYKLLTEEVK